MGNPAGVGPEIVLKAACHTSLFKKIRPFVFGDLIVLKMLQRGVLRRHWAGRLILAPVTFQDFLSSENLRFSPGILPVVTVSSLTPKTRFRFGCATLWGGKASGDYIEAAVTGALKKRLDAIVTAPISKEALAQGKWGRKFMGHTEMLAQMTGTKRYALMLVAGRLRAIHVTSHIPLRKVAETLTASRVAETIHLADQGTRWLGVARPRIAVCALNPHAGEGGLLGDEERKVIAPAVHQCQSQNLDVEGPFSADTVWPKVQRGDYDVGVAMYHDQGQIPVKLAGFGGGVNITVGLPIVRTSVDHGTAYDIAGKGIASEGSLLEAIRMAAQICDRKDRRNDA